MLELDNESKIIKKLLLIKEMFMAASWVGWTESLQKSLVSKYLI